MKKVDSVLKKLANRPELVFDVIANVKFALLYRVCSKQFGRYSDNQIYPIRFFESISE